MASIKGFILRSLERAGYAVVHVDALQRERIAAEENLRHFREARAEAARLRSEIDKFGSAPGTRDKVPPTRAAASDQTNGQPRSTVRALEEILPDRFFSEGPTLDGEWVANLINSDPYRKVATEYFLKYPPHSFMSARSRALLYCLIRIMKPEVVAEIGTAFAGTTEVMARALWENGRGIVLTTDPFGGDRVPATIARWPKPLRDLIRFYADDSMSFFHKLREARTRLDLVLVDGNHDFEFAFFDLSMAAQLLRPGGAIVMDNAEQSGPFFASRQFLAHNPGWREVGDAMARFDRSRPFDPARSSVPKTSFLILKAPESYLVQASPRSAGQQRISTGRVDGFLVELAPQSRSGILHYQAILRAFRDANREIEEYKRIGGFPVDTDGAGTRIEHRFEEPLVSLLHERKGDCTHTLEIELAWEASADQQSLQVTRLPQPIFST